MKKIVAIVLSLVMVLGLATTAFAATVPQWVTNGTNGFDIYDGNNVKCNDTFTGVKVEYHPAVAPSAANGYMGNIAYYTLDTAIGVIAEQTIYPVDTPYVMVTAYEKGAIAVKAHSDAVPTGTAYNSVGSQNVPSATYFLKPATVHYNWTAEKFTAFGTMCGDVVAPAFVKTAAPTQFTVRSTMAFAVNDPTQFAGQKWDNIVLLGTGDNAGVLSYSNYLVDGKIYTTVAYNTAPVFEAVSYVPHSWVASEYDKVDGTVTKYTCATCKVVGTVVASPFLAPADAEIEQLANLTYVYFYTNAAAAGDKVESAQTFDAGIAMYVGMSVMAAAGSAVVLKKKD